MQHILFYASGPNIALHATFSLVDSLYLFEINPAEWETKHLKDEWLTRYFVEQPKFRELLSQLVVVPGIREIVVSKYQLTIRHFPAFIQSDLITAGIKSLISVHELTQVELKIRAGSTWESATVIPTTEYFS